MEDQPINCRFLQIRGKVEVDDDYNDGEDLKVVVTITGSEIKNNFDGTFDKIYKARLFEAK